MKHEQFKEIAKLDGIKFIRALLELEEKRFEESHFLKGSTFEDINADFGIFPTTAAYPVYFAGDVCNPKGKIVFIGINPGFKLERNLQEQEYLKRCGLFNGYCQLYSGFFAGIRSRYYSNVAGFLKRLYKISEPIDWVWFQNHFLTLELIPYHSENANGLRINDITKFREIYFEILIKLLRHIDPSTPIFINGFPTYRQFLTDKNQEVLPAFRDVFEFNQFDTISVGTIAGKYKFIGLPFLARPRGGKDTIVAKIKRLFPQQVWRI
jgi:hypothetical protein